MKLIIDIDEKLVCEGFKRHFTEEERNILIRAIGNGTPYEERSQGDLISRDALKKSRDDYAEKRQDILLWQADIEEIIDNAPTVKGEILTKLKSDSAVDIDGFGVNGF